MPTKRLCYFGMFLSVVLIVISSAFVVVSRFMLGIFVFLASCSCAAWDGRLGTWTNPARVSSFSLFILCIVW